MTQVPPKLTSQNDSNSSDPFSQSIPLESQTFVTNYPLTGLVAGEDQPIKVPSPEKWEPSFPMQNVSHQKQQAPWRNLVNLRSASLRTKATLLALAIGTVPVALVGTTAYFAASQGIRQQIVENEQINVQDLEDKLNVFIRASFDATKLLATRDIFTDAKWREGTSREEKDATLDRFIEGYKTFDSVIVYDLKGNAIAQSEATRGDKLPNLLELDYTQAVLKTDEPVIVDPRVSVITGEYSFFAAAPIKDKDTGKTIAIVRIRMPMTKINEVFGVDPERRQEFFVTDSKGQIAAANQPQFLQKKLEELFPALSPLIKNKVDEAQTIIATQEGDEKEKGKDVITYAPNQKLAQTYNLNWGLVVSRPTEIAFAPQKQLLVTLLLGTSVVAVLVAALAAVIANRATRPIVAAAKAVDKIGQGELDTRLEVQGEDELALLGDNINNMASQIQTLLQEQVLAAEEQRRLKEEQRQQKEELQQRALELLKEVDPISKGDLTIRARVTADEIGTIADSYNATVANLRKIVQQVQQAAGKVAETTSSNEVSVQTLSAEALRQAEEIAEALNRAQEMAQSVRLIAENAHQAEAAVKQAAQTVEEGDAAMNRTVDGILAIRETVAETAKKVKHLGESSQKISTVVNLISTFAAQTNLLALNASIEAARAGEEGRGFAVVADEVRALARQSAEATSEIEKLVAAIQAETNEVVAAMESGTEQVVTGTHLVEETRQSLNKITAASVHINQLVESITQATFVQSQASQAVTQTMGNVAAIAQKTSQEASQVSSSFEELLRVAQALQEDVGQFKIS